jgi:SAM-dependent methyltransferase
VLSEVVCRTHCGLHSTPSVNDSMTSCPLCSSCEFEELFEARDPHYGISGTHQIMRCAGCSLTFVSPMYSDEESAQLYPDDYYAYQDSPALPPWKKIGKRILGYRLSSKDPKFEIPGRLLDIGCGSGEFLTLMRAQGWKTQGVEINAAAARAGRAKGLEIASGSLPDAQLPTASFDYVRASHSLEHMSSPEAVLEEMNRVLKPGGKLLIAVPNCESWNARLFKQYWWHLCPPLHAFNYSVQTLSRLLALHQFRVEKVIFNSDYLGLLGSAQIWRNRKSGKKSSEGLLFSNRPLRIVCGWLALIADFVHRGDMIEVIATKCVVQEPGGKKASVSNRLCCSSK